MPTDVETTWFSTPLFQEEEELCRQFIENKLQSPLGGIYTNYLDVSIKKGRADLATGEQILSESEGLIMLYYIKVDNQQAFDQHLQFVTDYLLTRDGVLRWRYQEDVKLTETSASIDDLRIIRALIFAYNRWSEERYLEIFQKISKGLFRHSKYNMLINGYDARHNQKMEELNLSYIDLYTLQVLKNGEGNEWVGDLYDRSLEIIDQGFISDDFPFYYSQYIFQDREYYIDEKINMIDTLLVVLHLSEVRRVKDITLEWINKKMNTNEPIYGQYDVTNFQPANRVQSTAIYAIIARIYLNIGDLTMYQRVMERMMAFQVKEVNSQIYGAFGNPHSLEVYSFDNLQALLAFPK